MYIEREITAKLASYLKQFKCVLVTGSRQVGKTTLLKHELSRAYDYVTLDDFNALGLAEEDPATFLNETRLPLIIDEVQLAPSLFRQAKLTVDKSERYGSIVLTGSQTYQLMQGVSESLAGRIGILNMSGLSLREVLGASTGKPYVPEPINENDIATPANLDIWTHIQRGSMPRLQDPDVDWNDFYSSYTRSYIERDVRQLTNIKNERKFYNFMIAIAARTGQLFNASDISNTVDVDVKTVNGWLSILQASGIIHIMSPFWAKTEQRLAKTPKIFFMDTGLACYLSGWNTPEQLQRGAMAGHMFETFVVSEVLKSFMNAGRDTRAISFYRDASKREIGLVIQNGRTLHPVEIKAGMTVRRDATKNFSALEGLSDFEIGYGHVVCLAPQPFALSSNVQAVPVWAI